MYVYVGCQYFEITISELSRIGNVHVTYRSALGPVHLKPLSDGRIRVKLFFFTVGHILYKAIRLLLGHAVVQLDEALRYKPEGRWFDSRWCHWNFSLT